jgi:hypothetical protein
LAPHLPPDLLRRARRRKARSMVLAGVALAVVTVLATLSSSLIRVPDRPVRPVAAGHSSRPRSADELKLMTYVLRDAPQGTAHPHEETGQPITLDEVRKHAECMRSHGFDVPDPTEGPTGWQTIIDDPKARGLDLSSPAFREAMFVTCGPLGTPLSGDMVIGGSRGTIDRFMACMSSQGFDLPEPTRDTSGRYDTEEREFDLTGTGIDTGTREWNEAMFVACSPNHS